MKRIARVLRWPAGIAALGLSYAVFELPGLLIALFVGAVTVTAARRKKSPIACIDVDGFRVDLAAMTMKKGEEEYAIRRTQDGQWEARAISAESMGKVVAERMELTEEQHLASVERGKAILEELGGGDPNAPVRAVDVGRALKTLPAGSRGRQVLLDCIYEYVKEVSGVEEAERAKKLEDEIEALEALKAWNLENRGFVPLPILEAPIETAYQRYIRQG